MYSMGPKKFFKKVGRGIQSAIGQGTNEFAKGVGKVLGPAAAAGIIAAAPYIAEAAPLMMLKTGGYVSGKRNCGRLAIVHGGETMLPANAKPTKKQKAIIASNKRKSKAGVRFC
jgi:hypothetical protein